jgi:hypothetical protein
MRMSRTITLTLISAAMLTACVTSSAGCNRKPTSTTSTTTDRTWYDEHGKQITENWKTDEDGKRVPDPHPRDKNGNLWATDAEGSPVPPTHTTTHTTTHRSGSGGGLWIFGGSGYRGSGPTTSSSSSSSSAPRSGFGSTGASMSGGS